VRGEGLSKANKGSLQANVKEIIDKICFMFKVLIFSTPPINLPVFIDVVVLLFATTAIQ
jgi:hypothetical protein